MRVYYTCELDPEVKEKKPGVCPLCSMPLRKVHSEKDYVLPGNNSFYIRRLSIALLFGFPVILLSLLSHLPVSIGIRSPDESSKLLFQMVLVFPLITWCIYPFVRHSLNQLERFSIDNIVFIVIPIIIATSISVSFCFYHFVLLGQTAFKGAYFEFVSLLVICLLSLRLLELQLIKPGNQFIKALKNLIPRTVTVIRDGKKENIDFNELKVGDDVFVSAGQLIPSDGLVLHGDGTANESLMSGSTHPVKKKSGDRVTGSTQVLSGEFQIRIEKLDKDTFLSNLIELVSNAQSKREVSFKNHQILKAFLLAALISPAVFLFLNYFIFEKSSGNFFYNLGFIVLCFFPIPVVFNSVLSTLFSIKKANNEGIIVKDSSSIYDLLDVHSLIFDKSGTVTEGQPKITAVVPVSPFSENDLLSHLASLEKHSNHPFSSAVLQKVNELKLQYISSDEFRYEPGMGIKGLVNSKIIHAGRENWFNKIGIDVSFLQTEAQILRNDGQNIVFLAIEGVLAGFIAFSDPIKPNCFYAVKRFKNMGLRTHLLTGDHETTAKAVSAKLEIDELKFDASPKEKINYILELQKKEEQVCLVGDGINNAPALAQADVGIAMGTGSEALIEGAQLVLTDGDLKGLVKAFKISKVLRRVEGQNNVLASTSCVALLVAYIFINSGGGFNNLFLIYILGQAFSFLIVLLNSVTIKKLVL